MPSAQNITNGLSKTAIDGTTVMTPVETIQSMTKGFDWAGIFKWLGIFLLLGLIVGCIYIAISQNKLVATPQNVANNAAMRDS